MRIAVPADDRSILEHRAHQTGATHFAACSLVIFFLCALASGHAFAQQVQPAPPVITAVNDTPVDAPAAIHPFSGLPLTREGWTDLHRMIMSPAYADARIVYVSNSGNDSTAQVYSPSSSALGGQPLNPSSQIAAFRTPSAAYERLRPGFPDVMLLRRGDSWTSVLRVTRTGRNPSERMIFAAYGPESQPRPIMRHLHTDTGARNVLISSIHNRLSGTSSENLRGGNVIYEDILWESPFGTTGEVIAVMLNGGDNNNVGGGMIRRSSASWTVFFAGNWGGATQTPSRFEENTISRSGLGTGYSNVYFSEGAQNIQSIRNQSLLTGNAGFRQRGGGIVRENLTMGTMGVTFGGGFDVHRNLTFERNVNLHTHGPVDITALQNANVEGNIFTAWVPGTPFSMVRWRGEYVSTSGPQHGGVVGISTIRNNIFYSNESASAFDFPSSGSEALFSNFRTGASYSFMGNDIVKAGGGQVQRNPNDSRITFQDQRYFSASSQENWFSGATYSLMIPATGTAVNPSVYPDPDRSIVTYMRSLGAFPSGVQQAIEWYSDGVPGNPSLAGAVANRRGAWDERFTAVAVINHIREGFGLPPLQP